MKQILLFIIMSILLLNACSPQGAATLPNAIPTSTPTVCSFPLPRSETSGRVNLPATSNSARLVITEFFNNCESGNFLEASYMVENGAIWWTVREDVTIIPLGDLVLEGKFGKLNAIKKVGPAVTLFGLTEVEVHVDCIFGGKSAIMQFNLGHLDAEKAAEAMSSHLKPIDETDKTAEVIQEAGGINYIFLLLAKNEEGWIIKSCKATLSQ